MKPLVILESPYRGLTPTDTEANVRFAQRALAHSLSLGEAPIASHLLYTQPNVLRDHDEIERQLGIDAGLAWLRAADRHVFYTDRGWSRGMLAAFVHSSNHFTEVYIRGLDFAPNPPPAAIAANLRLVRIILEWNR